MDATNNPKPMNILLVDDDPADVRLTREAFKCGRAQPRVHVVSDGLEALAFLRHDPPHSAVPTPDLILLDLNMPRKDGRELLAEIKADPQLKHIPVVVLTTSTAQDDILTSYALHANCYITKPTDLQQFMAVVRALDDFWFTVAKLPAS